MHGHGTLLKCPACPGTLAPCEVDGVVVDTCDGCGGIWFDRDELDKLVNNAARQLRAHGQTRLSQRPCPRDGAMMQTLKYPQTLVEAEVCPDCAGLWLDRAEADEIKAVRRHVARQGDLERYAPVPGAKGRLLAFIDAALAALIKPVE
mgnify:CR=1 FL=1